MQDRHDEAPGNLEWGQVSETVVRRGTPSVARVADNLAEAGTQ